MRHHSLFILVSLVLSTMSVSACTPAKSVATTSQALLPGQPGAAALEEIKEKTLTSDEEIVDLLTRYQKAKKYRRMMARLKSDAFAQGAQLLKAMQNEPNLTQAVYSLLPASSDVTRDIVKSAFVLFPLDRYALLHTLRADDSLDQTKLAIWASQTDVYIAPETSPAIASDEKIALEPLIESVAVTVADESEATRASVRFRENVPGAKWQEGYDLTFEPVQQIFSGSLVHLKPGTTYEVEVSLFDDAKQCKQLSSTVTTRPDKPPIDNKKIYQLADIYDGGTLDIEALGIEGSPTGWAKIVGDGSTVIQAGEGDRHAINIGDNAYIYFENITVRGGRTHAVYAEKAHHIWFNQCDIAQWGRKPNILKNGIAYESEGAQAINYDSALYFKQSGVITIENCYVHDPTPNANSWASGHPNGPNAFLAHANHPDPAFKGQIIIRNNHFTGTQEHRFNDVIEGRKNGEPAGGFVRNSAIYNNILAYSNDDVIELDGGQQNILVYNNDISHAYTGISATPVRIGPSYVFNNYIHDLGDQDGKQWAALKVGGLLTAPEGKLNFFHNLITVQRNGIGASRFQDDSTFWINARNNVIITEKNANMVGYTVYDPMKFSGSQFSNNYMFNLGSKSTRIQGIVSEPYVYASSLNEDEAKALFEQGPTAQLKQCDAYAISNFSTYSEDGKNFVYGISK